MPTLKCKHSNVKIYRPNGARYAQASRPVKTHAQATEAISALYAECLLKFEAEFGELPEKSSVVIDAVIDSYKIAMDLYEIKIEPVEPLQHKQF